MCLPRTLVQTREAGRLRLFPLSDSIPFPRLKRVFTFPTSSLSNSLSSSFHCESVQSAVFVTKSSSKHKLSTLKSQVMKASNTFSIFAISSFSSTSCTLCCWFFLQFLVGLWSESSADLEVFVAEEEEEGLGLAIVSISSTPSSRQVRQWFSSLWISWKP